MQLSLDAYSGEPIWRQIVEQVKFRIASGELGSGEKLPSIRGLGNSLSINPRTVVRAYEELSHLGLVVMRQGQGVFVRNGDGRERVSEEARQRTLIDLSRRLLAEGARMGATAEDMIRLFTQTAHELESNRNSS